MNGAQMLSKPEFLQLVADAYEHLYDIVYLRTHLLAELLVPERGLGRKDRAWQLHRALIATIEELNPGAKAPVFSREWRRHRLLLLHYVDGLDPQAVADELGISRRHYYRELDMAIEALCAVLWEQYTARAAAAGPSPVDESSLPGGAQAQTALSRIELLRLEVARAAQSGRYTCIADVVNGVLLLMHEITGRQGLIVRADVPEDLPGAGVDQSLLRQMLLGMLGYLAECATDASLWVIGRAEETALRLSVAVEPGEACCPERQAEIQDRLGAIEEVAGLSGIGLRRIQAGAAIAGFELHLPAEEERTLLVVDDNPDIQQLFRRYLAGCRYRVVSAGTAQEALELARRLQPFAITLDLMLPGQDGWDVMQTLLNQPETQHIPIIVCSVLRQKDLALSLGATAFLEKPVSEHALVAMLRSLESAPEIRSLRRTENP